MAKIKVIICPYCGETQPAGEKCRVCNGLFEPLSRQATHNAMGPWFVRDAGNPFQPGCSYETLARMVEQGRITKYTIVRGPTTRQFWTIARHTPGIAHLLGYCHGCDATVNKKDLGCARCGAPFGAYLDRNMLGLPDVKPMPWDADVEAPETQPAAWQGDFGVPRPTAPGISSFGTDEELIGNGQRFGAATLPELRLSVASPERATSAIPSERQALLEEDSYAAVRQRSLERQLQSQRQTMRLLIAVLALAVVAAIVSTYVALKPDNTNPAGTGGGDETSPDNGPVDDVAGGGSSSDDDSAGSAPVEPEPDEPLFDDGSEAPDINDLDDGEEATGPTGPAALDAAFVAEIARADALVKQSEDESLDIDARIKAIEEAIKVYREVGAVAPPDQLPDGFEQMIAAQERQLRRLTLKKFFP